MRQLSAIIILAAIATSACLTRDADRLDETSFTQAFAEALREADATLSIEIRAPLHVTLSPGEAAQYHVLLDNAYAEYAGAPEDLGAILEHRVRSALEMVAPSFGGSPDLARVVPIVRGAAYPAEVAASMSTLSGTEAEAPFHERLNDALVVLYAQDSESQIRYMDARSVASLGLEPSALRERAVDNLLALLPKVRIQGLGGRFEVLADGTYESSLLAVDGVWTKENFPVEGDIVVAVPCRNALFVTGSEDRVNVLLLGQMAKELAVSAPHRITDELFVRREGRWQRLPS